MLGLFKHPLYLPKITPLICAILIALASFNSAYAENETDISPDNPQEIIPVQENIPEQEHIPEIVTEAPSRNSSVQLPEDETTWVEEKISPSTLWIENLVTPWTQWMEKTIQRQTLHTVNRPEKAATEASTPNQSETSTVDTDPVPDNSHSTEEAASASIHQQPKIPLNEALDRVLQLYEGNVLSATFVNQVPPLYRIKLLLANGEIRIVHIDANTGALSPRS